MPQQLRLECLGGAREVGRNAFMLDNGKERILMDYGFHPEENELPLPAKRVDVMMLNHPHLDHSGAVPTLYRKATFPLYTTAACFDQAWLLFKDTMKLARLKGNPMMFTTKETEKVEQNVQRITFGQTIDTKTASVSFHDAGHVPGSFYSIIETGKKRILYTSDFKMEDTRLLRAANFKRVKNIDVLLTESTYASREHTERKQTENKLIQIVKNTIDNDGTAVIPVFAVGRAAEILMVVHSAKPNFPIYIDGMAREATEIALRYPELLRDPKALQAAVDHAIPLYTDEERAAALKSPCAIITTGGMLEGGPVVFYLKRLYTRPESSLTLTGYQAPRTAGRYLQDTGRYVTAEVDMAVKMQINYLDFSAHAGRTELFDLVKQLSPEKVICVHGDNCERFATELRGRFGVNAVAPEIGETVLL
jgi:putative mRNA 3-end processing factor